MKLDTESVLFKKIANECQRAKEEKIVDYFARNPDRFSQLTVEVGPLFADFSKNRITYHALELLFQLADQQQLRKQIQALYSGEIVNLSEKQAALHIALRDLSQAESMASFQQISDWVKRIEAMGITDVVHMGVGGSDLGPRFVCQSLSGYRQSAINIHFLSSHDSIDIEVLLKKLKPQTTLFLVVSKSFSTQETMINWAQVKRWLQLTLSVEASQKHFIAITANSEKAMQSGILPHNILTMHGAIGGRYSLWSTVGLVIALQIGVENFRQFLAGAHLVDQNFLNAPWSRNLSAMLGLIAFWYDTFFEYSSHTIIPYCQRLGLLRDYLQQQHMESLGKNLTQYNEPVNYHTGSILWGGVGADCQHSFHQLLMQGTCRVPIDFILPLAYGERKADKHLIANCLAQSEALMVGFHETEYPHKFIKGNNPSTVILMSSLTPQSVGGLIAMYEHKVYVEAVMWGINPFDQWGVERGKKLAGDILSELNGGARNSHDESTHQLIDRCSYTQSKVE